MKEVINKLIDVINDLDDKNYFLSILTYYNAATILNKKPATLLTLKDDNRNLKELWKKYKDDFSAKTNLNYVEIRETKNSILILFYNKESLEKTLFQDSHMNFLQTFGYEKNMSLDDCLQLLKQRFYEVCPHEMGLFLGIPLEDVIGFINCNGENCLMCGYWKVYHNPQRARNIFYSYDNAKLQIAKSIIKNVSQYSLAC